MNELMFEYEVLISMKEGLENVKILDLNQSINRTLLKKEGDYVHPIEVLSGLLNS